MSKSVQKVKRNLEPECITIDTTDDDDDEEDGYVKILYQQPDLPALEIPTDDNGDLPWKLIQALDPKINGLVIQSKEMRRIMKVQNGIIKEPKKGWKEFKAIALLEEPKENVVEEAIHSTASSRCNVSGVPKIEAKVEKENVPATDYAYSTNMSTPSPSASLPELAKSVKCALTKGNSVSTNLSLVHSTSADTNNEENSNSETSSLFPYSSTFASNWPTEDELFAAYNVESFFNLKNLMQKKCGIFMKFFKNLFNFLRKALIVHADKNVFAILNSLKFSNIFFKKLDSTASDVCELCQFPLTIGHLLTKGHMNKYYLKFNEEIPEIDIIVNHFYSNYCDTKEKLRYAFSTNAHSSEKLFDEYKDAFIHRISQQNLKVPIEDPSFLDRLLFLRNNLDRYSVPNTLNISPNFDYCSQCEKPYESFQCYYCHIFTMNHIRNALTQGDLNLICKLLSFVQKHKNGYKILLPLTRKTEKRKADDGGTNENTVPKKKSKNI